MNDRRERLYEDLMDATGEGTKSGALDAAARQYLRMTGRNGVRGGQGAVSILMEQAREQGSVTPEEIATILGTPEFPIRYDVEIDVGPE